MQWKKYLIDSGAIVGILCSFVLGVYAIKGIYPFGNTLILWGDMIVQGVPYLYHAYDVWNGMASPDFSWTVSAGIPWHSFSPFHLLLLLTERENIYQFVSIILLARMISMALAMYVFTCRYDVHRRWKIICSILYGMGSCILIYYQIDYVMMDIAILFPLLMTGFYSLLENRKPFLYVLVLALCIAHNIYVSYMVLLYLFSSSILYFYFYLQHEKFWEKCKELVLSTLLAIGLSSFAWMPAWSGLLSSSRMEYGTQGGILTTYLRAMETIPIFDLNHFIFCFYFFLGSGFLIATILSSWKRLDGIFRYHKFQILLICLAIFIPGTELLWHGGSRTLWPVRFAFIFNFVLIEIFLVIVHQRFWEISQTKEKVKKRKLILAALLGTAGLAASFSNFPHPIVVLPWIIFMTICYRYILITKIPWKIQILAVFLALEMTCNAFLLIPPDVSESSGSQPNEPEILMQMKSQPIWISFADLRRELSAEVNHPLFRIRDYYSCYGPNYAMIIGTSSISNGTGTVPRYLLQSYDSLGYVDLIGTKEHMDQMTDTGGTAFTDALLGIQAVFTLNTLLDSELYQLDDSVSPVHFYRHRYTMPIGIELSGTAMPDENVFSFQNNLFRAVTGSENVLFHEQTGNGNHWEIPVRGKQEIYFYSDNEKKIHAISINGQDVSIPSATDTSNKEYPIELNSRMIDFGTFENETVQLDFDAEDEYEFSQIHIGLLDIQMMADAFEQLQGKNRSSELETGPDFVQLEHISSDGGTLFLPIWFFQGWHCEVNGKETQLVPVLGGWIGVPLEQGNNRIYLKFRPETHWPSVCLSLASLGLGILFFILKTKGQLGHRWNQLGHAIGYIYLLLALVFLLLLYVLPIPLGIYYAVMK